MTDLTMTETTVLALSIVPVGVILLAIIVFVSDYLGRRFL